MLVSLYIENHPYLFDGKPQTINFGGKYIYSFTTNKEGKVIIDIKDNKQFIDNFFNVHDSDQVKINLATAIVGENGVGKSSILKAILELIKDYNKKVKWEDFKYDFIALFEDNGSISYHSNINEVKASFLLINKTLKKYKYTSIYYSPHFDIVNPLFLHEENISLAKKTFFHDIFSSKTDSISTSNYNLLKLTYNSWKRYIQFLQSQVFKSNKTFSKILPDISSDFGFISFNFKENYYPGHIPEEHRIWVGEVLHNLEYLIRNT